MIIIRAQIAYFTMIVVSALYPREGSIFSLNRKEEHKRLLSLQSLLQIHYAFLELDHMIYNLMMIADTMVAVM